MNPGSRAPIESVVPARPWSRGRPWLVAIALLGVGCAPDAPSARDRIPPAIRD